MDHGPWSFFSSPHPDVFRLDFVFFKRNWMTLIQYGMVWSWVLSLLDKLPLPHTSWRSFDSGILLRKMCFFTYSTWVRNLFIDFFLVWSEIFSEVLFQNIIYPPRNSPCNKQITTISSRFLWRERLRKMVQIATVRIWHWKKMRATEGWYGIDSELVLRIYKIMTIGQCETQNLLNSDFS